MTRGLTLNPLLKSKADKIKLLAMDVDGVLTDGKILFDNQGGEGKLFHVSDGLGLTLIHLAGISIAWISGRVSSGVERRASELKGVRLFQSIRDKRQTLLYIARENGLELDEVAYIGDDLNDIPVMRIVGLSVAVSNSAIEVKSSADYITVRSGGDGAVREVCDLLLKLQGIEETIHEKYLESLLDGDQVTDAGQ